MNFFNELITFLNLPIVSKDTIAGQVAYYSEIVFIIAVFLFIIHLIVKLRRSESILSTWGAILVILIFASGVMFIALTQIPEGVDVGWKFIKP